MVKHTGKVRSAAPTSEGSVEFDLGSDKLYFKIGEVAEIVGVPAYVLRYWETEFKAVKPQKSRTQHRVYRRRDVTLLLKIKHLLYTQKFTIAGARQQLKESPETCDAAPPSGLYLTRQSLGRLRSVVDEACALVRHDPRDPIAADPAAFVAEIGGAQALLELRQSEITRREQRRT